MKDEYYADSNALKAWQDAPLEDKIDRTVEVLERHKAHRCYFSFSGGIDSTVLIHIAEHAKIRKPIVFIDTGLEYPEVREFALSKNLYRVLKPEMTFNQVIKNLGFPVVSKSQAMVIRKLRTMNLSDKYRNKLLNGDERGSYGKLSDCWKYLLNAPFSISEQCCDVMKKKPAIKFEKEDRCFPITAEMAYDSQDRKRIWMKYGCSAFKLSRPKIMPMAFWTRQDVLKYIQKYEVDYAPVYGDIEESCNGLCTTGEQRTGCMFCMFGVHLEPEPNRFQRMQLTHPKLYDYCINKLGLGEVLEYINVPYKIYGKYLGVMKKEGEQLKLLM